MLFLPLFLAHVEIWDVFALCAPLRLLSSQRNVSSRHAVHVDLLRMLFTMLIFVMPIFHLNLLLIANSWSICSGSRIRIRLLKYACLIFHLRFTANNTAGSDSSSESGSSRKKIVQGYNINGLRAQAPSIFVKDFMRLGMQQAASSADKVRTIYMHAAT